MKLIINGIEVIAKPQEAAILIEALTPQKQKRKKHSIGKSGQYQNSEY